ncbi:MAG: glutamine--fructose-6-phosphate transaminase (isomerizing) [Clostridia bacterium]|nr:glutamine--fructose-6-phosphate transaminase (isomerizing) [Clostridia bacterium]
MCGIIGYNGTADATPLLLDGLQKLEYRGYDSAGIAVYDNDEIDVVKSRGKIEDLRQKIAKGHVPHGTLGIGHTRWATHGQPSDDNAHPHYSASRKFAVVHNGIIENFAERKEELLKKGYVFHSETDTEVVAMLLDENDCGDFLRTVLKTLSQLTGSFALGVLCQDEPETMICAKRSCPLLVAVSDEGNYIASDITAVLAHTRHMYKMEDDEVAVVGKDSIAFYNTDGEPIGKQLETVTWDVSAAEKGGYPHFMIKEIMEQPEAVRNTFSPRITEDGTVKLDDIDLTDDMIRGFHKINIVGCGSAYHVGLVARYVIEQLARIPVEVDLASEFRYRYPLVDEHTLTIVISQSGETADSLEALREAKRLGSRTLSVVNVVGSSIATESDDVLYTWAGPEISVATTKAYSTQLIVMDLLAIRFALATGALSPSAAAEILAEMEKLPGKIEKIFEQTDKIERIAESFTFLHHAYFIGRNIDYAVGLEASLKLKEVSYIHSEAYAGGELKHGTISLIEPGTQVVALCGCERLVDKTVSNAKELMARGAHVLGIAVEGNTDVQNIADKVIYIPETLPVLQPSLEIVPMQLLGYYTAVARKCDVDQPRNLAKSVTVE